MMALNPHSTLSIIARLPHLHIAMLALALVQRQASHSDFTSRGPSSSSTSTSTSTSSREQIPQGILELLPGGGMRVRADSEAEVAGATDGLLLDLADGAADVHDAEGARFSVAHGYPVHKGQRRPH